jgi:ferritin
MAMYAKLYRTTSHNVSLPEKIYNSEYNEYNEYNEWFSRQCLTGNGTFFIIQQIILILFR